MRFGFPAGTTHHAQKEKAQESKSLCGERNLSNAAEQPKPATNFHAGSISRERQKEAGFRCRQSRS